MILGNSHYHIMITIVSNNFKWWKTSFYFLPFFLSPYPHPSPKMPYSKNSKPFPKHGNLDSTPISNLWPFLKSNHLWAPCKLQTNSNFQSKMSPSFNPCQHPLIPDNFGLIVHQLKKLEIKVHVDLVGHLQQSKQWVIEFAFLMVKEYKLEYRLKIC